jgi:3-hydroxymyristoyl/3-hydroxydecanoyl-(acyl carrier protein) dehydratase
MGLGWESLLHFKVKSLSNNEPRAIVAELTIPIHWPEFPGHFPEEPVLPAVSIIDLSICLISQVDSQANLQKLAIEKSRFVGRVSPGQEVVLTGLCKSGKTWTISWQDLVSGAELAEIQVSF